MFNAIAKVSHWQQTMSRNEILIDYTEWIKGCGMDLGAYNYVKTTSWGITITNIQMLSKVAKKD